MAAATDLMRWLDEYSFEFEDDYETAYEFHQAILERTGRPWPFEVSERGEQTIVTSSRGAGSHRDSSSTLVLPSEKARLYFADSFEKRFLDGDADSHVGFMRNMDNPNS